MKALKVNATYKEVFNATLKTLKNNGFIVKQRNIDQRYITARKRSSLLSYGEKIEITFKSQNTGKVIANVSSYSQGLQIISWGVNDDNEDLIIRKLKKNLNDIIRTKSKQ